MESKSINFVYIFTMCILGLCFGAVIQTEDNDEDFRPCAEIVNNSVPFFAVQMEARCDKNGRFKPLQTFNMKMECYFPHEIDDVQRYGANGPCRKLRRCLRQKYHQSGGVKEHKWLRCDKYGYFKPLQKLKLEKARAICVDYYGNIRKTSDVTGKKDCLDSIIWGGHN